MPQDSVGTEDGDSCEYNQSGKDSFMYQDSVDTEDGDTCDTTKTVGTSICLRTT